MIGRGMKRGFYRKYRDADAVIAKYSCQHCAAAAARQFSRRLREKVSDSTVKSIKKVYIDELRKRPRMDNGGEIDTLTPKKRRRNVLVGDGHC